LGFPLTLSKLGKVFLLSFNAKNNQEIICEGVDAKGISDMLLIVTEKGSRL
jgi:hypothetical protein